MKLPWTKFVYAFVMAGALSPLKQANAQAQPNAENTRPPVQIFLTAAEKNGSPAALDASKLSVLIDKQPAQISALRSAKSDPMVFALLVDTSQSNARDAKEIEKAALQLFQGLSSDNNRGYLVFFAQAVAISRQPLKVSQVQELLDALRFTGGTAVYDAIEQTCSQKLSRSANPDTLRRVILLISDGDDNQSHVTRIEAEEAAQREGVAVFSLAIEPLGMGSAGEKALEHVSRETGGEVVSRPKLISGISNLLKAIENQWALTLVPVQLPDGHLHSFNLKASDKSIRISAPSSIQLP